jgi:predicted nucleic acid-binding protein
METSNNTIIVDSSGLISLIVESDSNHAAAVSAANNFGLPDAATALIPAEIFAETLNILGKKFGHEYAAGTVQAVLDSSAFAVVPTTHVIRLDALEQFRAQPGGVSYTDCLVMATADRLATRHIFGFDSVFRQSGYQVPQLSDDEAA